jgi:hypothetical protein
MNAFFRGGSFFACFISETRAAEQTSMKFGIENLQYMSGEFNIGLYRSSVTATLYTRILKAKFVTSPTSLPEKKSSSYSTNWQVRDEIDIDFYNTHLFWNISLYGENYTR